MIFRKILKAFVGGFADSIDAVIDGLVDSTQAIFNKVA